MRYGTRAMLELALRREAGIVSAKEIAAEQQVSIKYLEQVLSSLRAAGLVRSVRGAHGGHALSRPPDQITLREVYHALEGSGGLVECTDATGRCQRSGGCATRDLWAQMYAACVGVLESTTLQDLVLRTMERRDKSSSMYYI